MRRLHRFVTSAARILGLGLGLGLGASGCGGDVSRSEGCSGDASLFISWSFGAEPLAIACSARAVDHLEVTVESATCAGLVIGPVPCTLDRFRYDKQRAGSALIGVQALDARDRVVARGQVVTTLSSTIPATPVPITLR
jgi:hypothetical protein